MATAVYSTTYKRPSTVDFAVHVQNRLFRFGTSVRDAELWLLHAPWRLVQWLKGIAILTRNQLERFGKFVKTIALWLYHAPWRLIRWIGSAAILVIKVTLLIFAASWILFGSCKAIPYIRTAYKDYRELRAQQRLLEAYRREQAQRLAQEEELQRRCEVEQHERERQEQARLAREALRQREQEQARRIEEDRRRRVEEERRRQTEQWDRREEALLKQQRLDFERACHKWKQICQEVFKSGTGEITEPPVWPEACLDARC
ncbi:hypothetical protein K461DRAFT_292138 [Myriangium duriaei CBS 260.36]|uniref:Uncharacterized protein n=1 Tax=Myriangium duriaei CBS 260.36 TaxID=1168546 RepID=A0A9P4MHW0_9PEZI|nr:hypothetical protein K461DRAFT_292138 [Myriangium duriaei CBS 260.36]